MKHSPVAVINGDIQMLKLKRLIISFEEKTCESKCVSNCVAVKVNKKAVLDEQYGF
jgi:hypothetical protein